METPLGDSGQEKIIVLSLRSLSPRVPASFPFFGDSAGSLWAGKKAAHLFAEKHKLASLVTKLGGQENTVKAVLNAANGKLPSSGVFFDLPIVVEGQTIIVRGTVIDGVPRLGTMFIR